MHKGLTRAQRKLIAKDIMLWMYPEESYERDWFAEIEAMPTVMVQFLKLDRRAMFRGDCHMNCYLFCDVRPTYTLVTGWMASEGMGRAVIHSVVRQTSTGRHFDVTPPLQDIYTSYEFTPDPELEWRKAGGIWRRGIHCRHGVRQDPPAFKASLRQMRKELAV